MFFDLKQYVVFIFIELLVELFCVFVERMLDLCWVESER